MSDDLESEFDLNRQTPMESWEKHRGWKSVETLISGQGDDGDDEEDDDDDDEDVLAEGLTKHNHQVSLSYSSVQLFLHSAV